MCINLQILLFKLLYLQQLCHVFKFKLILWSHDFKPVFLNINRVAGRLYENESDEITEPI